MNAPKQRGQGNNQSAGSDQNTAGAGPIVQPGEDAAAIAGLSPQTHPGLSAEDFTSDPSDNQQAETHAGAPVAREMSKQEMTDMLQSLAKGQAQLTSLVASMARNRPVMGRHDVDQEAEVPLTSFELPTDGSIENLKRPDQRVEGLDLEMSRNMDHAQQLAFLEEYVVINIAETAEQGAENPVPLWVNGRGVAIVRGQETAVRRKYVELLLRAKPEKVDTRITRGGDGEPRNHIDKTRSLKYPFSIVLDRNQRGPAWARKIRAEA